MNASHFWFWPDHVAGKRETRRLREEHNKLAREHHELRIALSALKEEVEMLPCEHYTAQMHDAAVAATKIIEATKGPA